ncbi:Transmembrane and TPR repeat-containing protein F38B6.6, partial [Toxocara canis]
SKLTSLFFRLNRILFGLNTIPYHICNVALHCVVTLLVYQTTLSVSIEFEQRRADKIAFHTALLFAVHPVHTEAVANIVGRAELLMALFVLSVVNVYIRCIKMRRFTLMSKCSLLILSLFALFSKEQGITALPICVVLDLLVNMFWPARFLETLKQRHSDGRNNNRLDEDNDILVKNYLPCLGRIIQCAVAVIAMISLRLYINGFQSPNFSAFDNPIAFHPSTFYRAVNYCYLIVLNVWLLINPSQLCFDYSMGCITVVESLLDYRLYITIAFLIMVAILSCKCFVYNTECNRLAYFGVSIAVLAFLPASNLFFTVGFVLAERVLYLPSVGFCILVAIAFDKIQSRISDYSTNEMLRFTAFVVLLLAATKSMKRCIEWRREIDLYRSGLTVCPKNAKIHYNLGKVLADSGDSLTAEISYKSAIRLNPSYDHAMNNLANIYLLHRRYREAEELLTKCVQIRPDFAAAWMNLGLAMLGQRKFKESEESFRTSLTIRPNYPDCIYNMGNLYLQQNKKHLAEYMWRNVTRIQANHERAWVNLLVLLDESDDCEGAIELANDVLKYLDHIAPIHFQLGTCLGKLARFKDAEHHLHKAIALQTNNALYWTNLGILYQRWNRMDDAIEAYRTTLRLQPNSRTAKENLEKLLQKGLKSSI